MSDATNPYNATVRRHFANPAHAGDLQTGYAGTFKAEAAESAVGCRVVLALALDGDKVQTMRFRVFGCPHLIAACEVVCASVEGRPVEALRKFPLQELMLSLAVPVEKTGRILLLEDAVIELARKVRQG